MKLRYFCLYYRDKIALKILFWIFDWRHEIRIRERSISIKRIKWIGWEFWFNMNIGQEALEWYIGPTTSPTYFETLACFILNASMTYTVILVFEKGDLVMSALFWLLI